MYSKHSQIEKPKVFRSRFHLGLSYLIYYHPKFKYFGYHQNVGLALAFAFVLNSKLLEIIFYLLDGVCDIFIIKQMTQINLLKVNKDT